MSASGFPITKFDKRPQKWYACIYISDKYNHLGIFSTQAEAFESYEKKHYKLEQEYLNSQSLTGDEQ